MKTVALVSIPHLICCLNSISCSVQVQCIQTKTYFDNPTQAANGFDEPN